MKRSVLLVSFALATTALCTSCDYAPNPNGRYQLAESNGIYRVDTRTGEVVYAHFSGTVKIILPAGDAVERKGTFD